VNEEDKAIHVDRKHDHPGMVTASTVSCVHRVQKLIRFSSAERKESFSTRERLATLAFSLASVSGQQAIEDEAARGGGLEEGWPLLACKKMDQSTSQ